VPPLGRGARITGSLSCSGRRDRHRRGRCIGDPNSTLVSKPSQAWPFSTKVDFVAHGDVCGDDFLDHVGCHGRPRCFRQLACCDRWGDRDRDPDRRASHQPTVTFALRFRLTSATASLLTVPAWWSLTTEPRSATRPAPTG